MDDSQASTTSNSSQANRVEILLHHRQELTDALAILPYDLILYLERAAVYSDLAYPDLAAGDAYKALLLTDEVLNPGFEYNEQARAALEGRQLDVIPSTLNHGLLSFMSESLAAEFPGDRPAQVARLASVRSFQILALNLLLCGCLKSAHEFCERGLTLSPTNPDLLEIKVYIREMASRRLNTQEEVSVADLPDAGLVRREIYPWNDHEPDRFSSTSLDFLNGELARYSPKCAVQAAELPVLLEGASETDNYDIIPTCSQLGLFATEDISPGEPVLEEYSLLTANNRLKEPLCDACSSDLPALGSDSTAVNCEECQDTVFCSQFCHDQAQQLYHPSVCEKEVDAIAKDPEAKEAEDTLHLLLLARVLALSNHQGVHPLETTQVKYIWGDFVPSSSNEIDLSLGAGPPPAWTLPFSFKYNIETPLHILEKMDVDVYQTLSHHDLWIFNTLYSKFRGTASARKSTRDGRSDVAAVHPFWCLANHDCDPNVTWEWGGRMVLWAREKRIVSGEPGGIKAGEEILNHYCDVTLPVQLRREWASGSLGGWCMCKRCRNESAVNGMVLTNGVCE